MILDLQRYRLRQNAQTIRAMVGGISEAQSKWKPSRDSWSILEVVTHLYDEEREDFRPRLDIMLHRPSDAPAKIDPVRWAIEREYNERTLAESLGGFIEERDKSLQWLAGLQSPDWSAEYMMPSGKSMRAGDMLAAWVAHDLLHMRQLVKLLWRCTTRDLEPYKVDYAGPW